MSDGRWIGGIFEVGLTDIRTDGHTDGHTDGRTDGRMDGRTDEPSYRDARTHLKIVSVTREARNVRFFWASRSLFLDYKFKRFLQWLEFKWSFAKLKEEILIGEQCFSAVFC